MFVDTNRNETFSEVRLATTGRAGIFCQRND